MQVDWPDLIRSVFSEETAFSLAVAILFIGLVVSYSLWRWTHRLLDESGISDAVEGTTFDRTAQRFGTSTAGVIGTLLALFVYTGAIIVAFHVAQLFDAEMFWNRVTQYVPRLFIAILALITGLLAGDKAKLEIQERLQSIKLPEASVIPELVKYSIFYIAALIALAQLGVATAALLVLLAAYAFGIVFLGGIAFKDLLAASAAGIYLLLTEPYSIGDEVRIDDKRGIVQEIDMFVTRIETDGEEYIIPNQQVLRSGIIRIRE
jgi:small-conductance mechanosensitive channel